MLITLPPAAPSSAKSIQALIASAKRALEIAGSFEEVKDIRDRAQALRVYIRSIDAGRAAQNDAAEITILAEHRLGAELSRLDKASGTRGQLIGRGIIGGNLMLPPNRGAPNMPPPTLAELGISKMQSSRWQTVAAIPHERIRRYIAEIKASGEELTTAAVLRFGHRFANNAQRAGIASNPVTHAASVFGVIVIDPPWPMKKMDREVRPNQVGFDYPTMTEEELADFPVSSLAAEDCHLFCWTTQRFLPMALRLVEQWGFYYSCTFTWHKPGGVQPIGLPQFNSEFVVYARQGSPTFTHTKHFYTCFSAPRREHSRKLDEFYDTVRRVTDGSRIDVFSRERRSGFAQYGNQTAIYS